MGDTKFTSSRTFYILVHTLSWLVVFAIPTLLQLGSGEGINPERFLRPSFISFHIAVLIVFYFNAFFLCPKLLFKKHTVWYIISALALTIAASLLVVEITAAFPFHIPSHEMQEEHDEHHHHFNFLRELFSSTFYISLVVCIVSTAYRIIRDRNRTEKQLKERETEHLKSELTFLRSQVSPHFMFNVLNNIVALARKKSEMVEPVVIKLSHLMRYMLYEADENKVAIEKEIEYLHSYIDLQMLRFGNDVKLRMDIDKVNMNSAIEPMLLIPFVENAFKHGVVLIDDPEIDITLTSDGNELVFSVKNKFNDKVKEVKDKSSGIGLQNVRRRLNLLYKDDHTLSVKRIENWFFVELRLKMK